MTHTYSRLIRMIISRLKASGLKWYKWYSRTQHVQDKKHKFFPRKHRNRKLIVTTQTADYTITPVLYDEFKRIKQHLDV